MFQKLISLVCCAAAICLLLVGCAKEPDQPSACPVKDGVYSAVFKSDSSMFHVNEAKNDRGVLTVKDGKMTIHIVMPSKSILNLFPGLAADAAKDGAQLLKPSEESVTYSDGFTETVYAFDIPVPVLDEEFDCALIGKKGTWYDHKVTVSDLRRVAPPIAGSASMEVTLSGGSGRASIQSPARIVEDSDGTLWAVIIWSSKNYEYMLVDDIQYDPIQEPSDNSTFLIPISKDADIQISALTVAMSEPHLVEYTLHFDGNSLKEA